MVSAGFKHSKLLILSTVLASFVATGLASCAPRPLPGGATNAFTRQSVRVFPIDNFNGYLRHKMRSEGFVGGQEPEPIEGTRVQVLPAAGGAKALTYMTYEALDNNLYQRHRKTSSVHGEDIPSEGHK